MSINSKIKAAIEPIVPDCEPNVYNGASVEYCTFNYTEMPTCFGNDEPGMIRYLVQVHWLLPAKANPLSKKKSIKSALLTAGFTYPSVTPASDSSGQHYVFECEFLEGVSEDG